MRNIICGDIEYDNIKYKFDFRDNILILLPEELQEYTRWYFEHLGKKEKFEYVNIEGVTNSGWSICFIHVKFSHLGRGALQAFVPGYAICKTNAISPVPKCEQIEKIRFFGSCLDKFYYPKKIIETNDFLHSEDIKIEIKKQKLKTDDFIVNKDKFSFGVFSTVPYTSNINIVLDVSSYLEIKFNGCKSVAEIVEYYLDVKKFFSFINNRKYIKFDKIVAFRSDDVNYGISDQDDIRSTEIEFEFSFVDPDEKFDLNNSLNNVRLEDLGNKFSRVYKEVTKKKFLTEYYPLSIKDDHFINNDKYTSVASAFESEFNKLYVNFKSTISSEYSEIKKLILKSISNKKSRTNKKIKSNNGKENNKSLKTTIKECDYFSKIIKNIDGTLHEKIVYCYKKYNKIIECKKDTLLKNYELDKAKSGLLADKVVKRRNDIAHGNGTNQFDALEIIAYELLRMCIYCITLERCNFSEDKIKEFINKIF